MQVHFEALARCPLFEGVPEADVAEALARMGAKPARFGPGELIFLEGSPADRVGILLVGAARVQREDFLGNREILSALVPGDLFGEAFACAGVKRLPVSVEAVEPCRVLLIRLDGIIEGGGNDRVFLNLLRVLAAKNLRLNEKLAITSRRTTRQKLMAYLYSQAKAAGSEAFTIPFDRQGLADYLGVDRSALSAEIGKLRREGVIESEKNRFRLLNVEGV